MSDKPVKMIASPGDFAAFGAGAIGYVRRIRSDDLNAAFPLGADLPVGLDLWGLFSAEGQPLAVSDDETAVLADAQNRSLVALYRQ